MLKRTVQIGSEEFKQAVLDVIKQSKPFANDIDNPRFERLSDGWIKDLELGLDWGPSSTDSMNHAKAQEYCKNLGGRLPTVDELQSIIDRTLWNPAFDKSIFKDGKCEYYWASDKYMNPSYNAYWCVSFSFGYVNDFIEFINFYFFYVRPVRSSQC